MKDNFEKSWAPHLGFEPRTFRAVGLAFYHQTTEGASVGIQLLCRHKIVPEVEMSNLSKLLLHQLCRGIYWPHILLSCSYDADIGEISKTCFQREACLGDNSQCKFQCNINVCQPAKIYWASILNSCFIHCLECIAPQHCVGF